MPATFLANTLSTEASKLTLTIDNTGYRIPADYDTEKLALKRYWQLRKERFPPKLTYL